MHVNGDPSLPGWGPFQSRHYLRRYAVAGDAWDVALALPPSLAQAEVAPALLIVLDGSIHFEAMAATVAALERRSEKTMVGPTVIVGIASGIGWTHDSARRIEAFVPGETAHAHFSDLICGTLMPELSSLFALDPARCGIFGHSFGGVFALDVALRMPELFGAAIAVSPSLWRAPDLFGGAASPPTRGQRILLASGEREPDRINDPLRETVGRLEQRGREARYLLMPDEDHGSVPFTVMPAALRLLHR